MDEIHMGQLLEKLIRRKGINITELAAALKITRRTLYNWFKLKVINEVTMQKISSVIVYDFNTDVQKPIILNQVNEKQPNEALALKDEAYWQDRYVDLLERYSDLLAARRKNI
jgi:transcriptional antiterminator